MHIGYLLNRAKATTSKCTTIKANQGRFIQITAISMNFFHANLKNGNPKTLMETMLFAILQFALNLRIHLANIQ